MPATASRGWQPPSALWSGATRTCTDAWRRQARQPKTQRASVSRAACGWPRRERRRHRQACGCKVEGKAGGLAQPVRFAAAAPLQPGYALLLRFALLRHFERKLLRALPCKPFSSACFEHSIEAALRAEGSLLCAHAGAAMAMSPVRSMARNEVRMAIDLSRTDRRPNDNARPGFWVREPRNKRPGGAQPRPTGPSQAPQCERAAVDAAAPWQRGG